MILGAAFVVFQLRQNAKLIQATIQETRANASIALLEKITDESFSRRRKSMRDAMKKYASLNWDGFDDTLEDYDARNFAYTYELIGQLARENVIDLAMVRNALQYLVVFDWDAFKPLSSHLMERYEVNENAWSNFEWLAEETRRYMKQREAQAHSSQ